MGRRSSASASRSQFADRDESDVVELPARVTVNLPAKVWDELTKSAKVDGISRTESLRRAVWVYLFFRGRIRAGHEVILEDPDGRTERVIFPY